MSLGKVEALAGHVQKTVGRECEPMDALHERTPQDETIMAYDDVSGEELELKGVREARREEIAYFRSMKVYEKVPAAGCRRMGLMPISTRWVDVNKADE